MNERFKQLYLCSFAPSISDSAVCEEGAKKFAELIVQECIGCCEQVISDPVPELVDTWLNGGEQCIQEIKQHFGVEE
jgi:hypothetical protein